MVQRKKPDGFEAIQLKVNGEVVVIDPRTLTGRERQKMKRAIAAIDYEPDDADALYITIWIVMSRTDPNLTLDEVLDAVTIGDLERAETASGDDSPEA
jgi:hypothetical protein